MAGFTAINAHATSTPTATVNDVSEENGNDADQQKTTKRRQPARKKAAPADPESQVANSKIAPKRISGKGRKRTNEPSDEPGFKRRKSGSVKLNIPITKTGVNTDSVKDPEHIARSNIVGTSSTDADLISLDSRTKLNGFRYSNESAAEPNTFKSKSATSHPAYMPQTSMNSVVSKEQEDYPWYRRGTAKIVWHYV